MSYKEQNIKVSDLHLDQSNPRFPAVNSQREAIQAMVDDQGDKIVNLASDIYQNGLNPSSRLIIFKEGSRYIDGDGNRRLTALKILETPSLADSNLRIRKKIDLILKMNGSIPSEIGCIVFANRKVAKHWISINHGGEQDGRGQINWNPEQKDRFEGKASVGLEALDCLVHKKMITQKDKDRINKSTLDRLLSYKDVKSQLSISKNGDSFSFGDTDKLQKVVFGLMDKKVDVVYTATKGKGFVNDILSSTSTDSGHGNSANQAGAENDSGIDNQGGSRSRRKKSASLTAFGGSCSLKPGHVNNLYRDIESLYGFYLAQKRSLSADFIVIFRMSLRMLAETAANELNKNLKEFLVDNFDQAKKLLDQNTKTSLANQSVEKGKIVQLFQTGAHDYVNSKNEEQALAMSIILGAILTITHRRTS
jgi:hypothetical protein